MTTILIYIQLTILKKTSVITLAADICFELLISFAQPSLLSMITLKLKLLKDCNCMQGKNFIGGVVGGDNAMVNNLMDALSGGDC